MARDPSEALDDLGRIAPAILDTQVEGWPAGHSATRGLDLVFAKESGLGAVALVAALRGIVEERTLCGGIPRHVPLRAAVRREAALGQQPAGVRADEERAVRPVANERTIIPATLDHDVRDAERERPVAAGPHAEPDIGLAREADAARIDHDEPSAPLERRHRR